MLTTIQSNIAADLDAFEEATWFTSAYLVAMSSMSPLVGRLSQVFSPRGLILYSSVIICIGTVITSMASSLAVFLLGRATTGLGAGGVLITSTIIIIELAPTSKRGLLLGLINAGMTTGVSLGAVLAGALEPKIGWVRPTHRCGFEIFFFRKKNYASHAN
jgi:MFS family permease